MVDGLSTKHVFVLLISEGKKEKKKKEKKRKKNAMKIKQL
jgi:hypothetical protein